MTIWFLLQVPVFHYTPASTETKGGPLYHEFHDDKIPHFVPIQQKGIRNRSGFGEKCLHYPKNKHIKFDGSE